MGLFCINIEFLTVCSLFTTQADEIPQRNITRDSLDQVHSGRSTQNHNFRVEVYMY